MSFVCVVVITNGKGGINYILLMFDHVFPNFVDLAAIWATTKDKSRFAVFNVQKDCW